MGKLQHEATQVVEDDEVFDVDPDSSTPEEILEAEDKKKDAAQAILDAIANEDEQY
jgi:hypothetical protein